MSLFPAKLNGRYGFINARGELVIEARYTEVNEFNDGLAQVYEDKSWDKCFFIDESGNVVLRTDYYFMSLSHYHHGVIAFEERGLQGFMDRTGKVIIKPRFSAMAHQTGFRCGRCVVRDKDHRGMGLIDLDGEWVVPPGRYTMNCLIGEGMIPAVHVQLSSSTSDVVQTSKWGCLDLNGNIAVDFKFIYVGSFGNGLALAKLNENKSYSILDTWHGFINKRGDMVLPPIYRGFRNFSEGLNPVSIAPDLYEFGYIDMQGNWAIPPRYSRAGSFSEGLAAVSPLHPDRDERRSAYGLEGYIDTRGNIQIPFQFEAAERFKNGLAKVILHDGNRTHAYINRSGMYVWPPELKGRSAAG